MPTVLQYQRGLLALGGTDPGPLDGLVGPRTYAALEQQALGPIYLRSRHDLPAPKHYASPRGAKPRTITRTMLHWPGGRFGARYWANFFANTNAYKSVHWVVDETGAYQLIDHARITYHAKGHNTDTIGVEICQYPFFDERGKTDAANRNIEVRKVTDPPYLKDNYATLDPLIERNVVRLCSVLGLQVRQHAQHSTTGKIDILPWYDRIVAQTLPPRPL